MAVQLPVQFEFKGDQSFADYFAGSNKEIVAHLQDCVTGKGEQQIYLWGERGLGKSHLLQACCQKARQQAIQAFYYSMQPPLPDASLLEGLEEQEVVCFDNIGQLAGNPAWENAFFVLFNQLRDRGQRLIVSDNCPPKQLPISLPDLKTRLAWGLTLHLQPLTDQDCIALISFKARRMGFDIPPRTGQFLLTHYARDLPSLWALLARLDHASLAAKRKLTIPFIKQILQQ